MPENERDPEEERLLQRLRGVSIVVFLSLIILIVTAFTLGTLFVREYEPSEVVVVGFLGSFVGAIFVLLGLATVPKK